MENLEAKSKVGFLKTLVGWLRIEVGSKGVKQIGFVESGEDREDKDELLDEAKKQLGEYFAGKRKIFELPVEFEGTEFQVSVWKELMKIPYGKKISYAQLAGRVGRPKAMRAVGNANGRNPVPIVVACHRVVASDGSLGGYSAGVERKEWLLEHEEKVGEK